MHKCLLTGNNIGDSSVKYLAEVLKTNTTLTKLDLSWRKEKGNICPLSCMNSWGIQGMLLDLKDAK